MSTTTLSKESKDTTANAYFDDKKTFFKSGNTLPYTFRKEQLKKLKAAIVGYEYDIGQALKADLHKPDFEAYTSEVALLHAEVNHTLKHLKKWMKPESVPTSLIHFPSKSKVYKEPLGVSLIIGPWNYPFQLLIAPLIGAIAAGNTVVLKPSELTPHTSKVIEDMISHTFDRKYISVIQGDGAKIVPQLMENHRFDHIFFTGSVPVGKIIAKQAAEKLTPVTLELGGKSPAIVDHTAKLKVAARRIAWGKAFNAGQTCVSPDYLLLEKSIKEEFITHFHNAIEQFYGELHPDHQNYGRILNQKRFDTLIAYLDQGNIMYGGKTDREKLFIGPTLIDNVDMESPIMQEEIFGPILPVLTFSNYQEVIETISINSHPLSLYHFTSDKKNEKLIRKKVQFGGGAVNDTIVHLSNPNLPFGGIGSSGYDAYHGKHSFDTFTHKKSIMRRGTWIDLPVRYAPYTKHKKKLAKLFM
ncbi:aldehyde dehydrogenase (NAD+) [Catalinimonas alkaloidigena]|uniref:aldehyde dehydrogenase n=1 Tax=Catalinimonas alkaloidigena TaxID=1075417 RepID=UPI002405A4C1|nr:aldehyde dehydrogenase [Catalinimonas alkaloidigena]MDF9795609.1 aldehyde dehydrogenase (NAD+) [Catalinimonas alkaloidigena]